MYTKSKYLVGEVMSSTGFLSCLAAIVFPETIGHDEVAKLFVPGTIQSGGFCHIEGNEVIVYGKSVSVQVEANPNTDVKLLKRTLALPSE